jgi:hypothetical protein
MIIKLNQIKVKNDNYFKYTKLNYNQQKFQTISNFNWLFPFCRVI